MNIHHCCTPRNLILAAVLTIGFASSALAQDYPEDYRHHRALIVDLNSKEATNLGTLGGDYSVASGINDAGQVVGQSRTGNGLYHAFITGADGVGMTDLGTLGGDYSKASGINGAGQVVGQSQTDKGQLHAFITGPNGAGMTDLGTLSGEYYSESFATGINEMGQVVGYFTSNKHNQYHAFITGPNGVGMTELGTLGGDYSLARGINQAGQVVGSSGTVNAAGTPNLDDKGPHAFITGPNGAGMTDLGTLRGLPYSTSYASGLNEIGQVVGTSFDGVDHAFITGPDGAGMTDLGRLGGEYYIKSFASGINDMGQVVGGFENDYQHPHAFITGPDGLGMTDLASVVKAPTGFSYVSAAAINNHGQLAVVGMEGIVPDVPEPEMYAMLLVGLGLIGCLARGRATA